MCPQPPPNPPPRNDDEEVQHRLAPPTVPELLRTVQESQDAASVETALAFLIPASLSNARLMSGSIQHIVAAMQRFPNNQDDAIQLGGLQLLTNLASPEIYGSAQAADTAAQAMLDARVVELCSDLIREGASSAVIVDDCCRLLANLSYRCFQPVLVGQEGHADVLRAVIHALQCFPRNAHVQSSACAALLRMTCGNERPETIQVLRSVGELGGIELCAEAMRTHPGDLDVQRCAIGILCHTSRCQENVRSILELGGVELVLRAMKTHLDDDERLQRNGCNFIRSICCNNVSLMSTDGLGEDLPAAVKAQSLIATSETVDCVLAGMRKYPDFEPLQFVACSALFNFTAYPNTKMLALQAGAIEAIVEAMTTHEGSAVVQEHALGFLWNMCDTEEHRVALTEAGCVQLIVKAMEMHSEEHGVQKEGSGALYYLAVAKDDRVRLALTCTTDAIPVLHRLFNKYNALAKGMMLSGNFGDFGMVVCMSLEKIGDALGRLGVMEDTVIGAEEDYDPDEDVGEYPIESPPFDIGVLLDKDLTNDSPGWYKHKMFRVDWERSKELGPKFLRVQLAPVVGQKVCLWVVLPYGGRGYIYGTVSDIAPSPTDEELEQSSVLFGKGCPCPKPACPVKTGTREELMAAYGALHGQEVIATVSLSEGPEDNDRKVRFAPLPAFFRGEDVRYKMTIRLDEKDTWKVVRIETESTDGN